ncbi:MAG: alpha/beta hydrolase [Holophaga sp.]
MKILVALVLVLVVAAAGIALAIGFGGPGEVPSMPSINDPFARVDYSDLPALSRYSARDGAHLAYRAYGPEVGARGSVVLVHGSSASGVSMHVLAKGLAAAGYRAFALDLRGHGDSGPRGTIAYVGQLEDDLEDFLDAVRPPRPIVLAGFSSGGGFALRFAGDPRHQRFDGYLLLSPLLGRDAPTFRPEAGGWAKVGVPRLVAISLLNRFGIRACNGLPVVRFALDEYGRKHLTPAYSYSLATDFMPWRDWRANIRAVRQPMRLMAGQEDEVFHAERFEEAFRAAGHPVPVTLVSGVGHVSLTLDPAAVQAAVGLVGELAR